MSGSDPQPWKPPPEVLLPPPPVSDSAVLSPRTNGPLSWVQKKLLESLPGECTAFPHKPSRAHSADSVTILHSMRSCPAQTSAQDADLTFGEFTVLLEEKNVRF